MVNERFIFCIILLGIIAYLYTKWEKSEQDKVRKK